MNPHTSTVDDSERPKKRARVSLESDTALQKASSNLEDEFDNEEVEGAPLDDEIRPSDLYLDTASTLESCSVPTVLNCCAID